MKLQRVVLVGLMALAALSISVVQAATVGKIIVSGASGQLGGLTVKELLARGVKPADLILVSRTPENLAEYAKLGASVRMGDPAKPETLAAAYKGGKSMLFISIGISPGAAPRPEIHKAAFDAAVKAGVKHIVYTSFLGADVGKSGLAQDHFKSENYLKASGAAWTMLRNGLYADGLVRQGQQMVTSGKAEVNPNEVKLADVTREDCAAAAAGALLNPKTEYKTYDITGPELLGTRELAKLVSEVTGKPIEVTDMSAAAVAGARPPMGGAEMSVVSKAVQELAGRPATSMRAFLEQNKAQLLMPPAPMPGPTGPPPAAAQPPR